MSQKYNDSILKIADYLCSDHKKAEYVVNCFIQQEVNTSLNFSNLKFFLN